LGVDPLRLIASGALLVACSDGDVMVRRLVERGIPATLVGQMTDRGRQLVHPDGRLEEVDRLDRDELYRILEERRTV
jgi:hydrogenase maturation factor